jgi:hypothetical protein
VDNAKIRIENRMTLFILAINAISAIKKDISLKTVDTTNSSITVIKVRSISLQIPQDIEKIIVMITVERIVMVIEIGIVGTEGVILVHLLVPHQAEATEKDTAEIEMTTDAEIIADRLRKKAIITLEDID